MSRRVIALTIILSAALICGYLVFASNKGPQPLNMKTPLQDAKQELHPRDSAQCAVCRQVADKEPQTQCLKDFQCN